MSASHDRQFFDTFMLIIGVLIGIAAGLYVLARLVARTQDVQVQTDPAVQARIEERIAPFGRVAIAGRDNTDLEIMQEPPGGPAAGAVAAAQQDLSGEQVYDMACVACHGQGIGGAPKFGDVQAWAPRVAKGKETLYEHSLQGFQGSAGYMPPKGGRVDLADTAVVAAVDYMVEAVE